MLCSDKKGMKQDNSALYSIHMFLAVFLEVSWELSGAPQPVGCSGASWHSEVGSQDKTHDMGWLFLDAFSFSWDLWFSLQ